MTWWGWLLLAVSVLINVLLFLVVVVQAMQLEQAKNVVDTLEEMSDVHRSEGLRGLRRFMDDKGWDA